MGKRYPTLDTGDVERILINAGFKLERQVSSRRRWRGVFGGQTRFVTVDVNDSPRRA